MLSLYYLANQVYQLSFALPIYKRLGGRIIVSRKNKVGRFRKALGRNFQPPPDGSFVIPEVEYGDITDLRDFTGVILSQSNRRITTVGGRCITVFMGHGTGDKTYGENAQTLRSYNYHFISGAKHRAKLADAGVEIPEDRAIQIGNPRFDDYINGAYDRQLLLEDKGVRELERKVVLFAPTWKDGGGTLLRNVFRFARELDQEYTLLVRPHHFDARLIPFLRIWFRLRGFQHVYFSNPDDIWSNDTMQDFATTDILISDTSSLLYDFLITGKPIILAPTEASSLHTMPEDLDIRGIPDVYIDERSAPIADLIGENLETNKHSARYAELLQNCFYFNDGKSTERAVDFLQGLN